MKKILIGIGIAALAYFVVGPTMTPKILTPQEQEAKIATEVAERQAQREAKSKKEREDVTKLAVIEHRMSSLGADAAWRVNALSIASEINTQPQTEALLQLKQRWRARPDVIEAATAETIEKTTILKREAPALLLAAQKMYAEKVDRVLLDARIEASATVSKNKNGGILKIKSAGVGRVFADQLANKVGMYQGAEKAGFSQLVFENSITGSTITYDLSPQLTIDTRALEREILIKWAMAD